jgi:hypothetical protein
MSARMTGFAAASDIGEIGSTLLHDHRIRLPDRREATLEGFRLA